MKVAIIHDYLNQLGGGERVLDVLLEMFPEADLYTLLHDAEKTRHRYEKRLTGTSFLDVQFARNHHRLFIPLMPLAAHSINLKDRYDLIISDTAGFAKGIRYDFAQTKHLSYIHTPLRYAWETSTYFGHGLKNWLVRFFGAPAFWYLRRWDKKMAQRPHLLLANSQYIADKIKKYYARDARVVYPPVSAFWSLPTNQLTKQPGNYYLAAGRLLHYKRFDLVIDAFAELGLPLKIVGSGPEFLNLRAATCKLQARNIEFLGYVSEEQLRELYAKARAFVMPNEEDFGLVMAEALSCGTPVIAYGAGGAREIVEEGRGGLFFQDQTSEALVGAVKKFEQMVFNREEIVKNAARRFSGKKFEETIRSVSAKLYAGDARQQYSAR